MTIPFDSIKDRVSQGYVRSLCERWLPHGQPKGAWWVARVPWREDRTPSLGVHLVSGNYKDFGRPEDRGDIISLYAKLARVPVTDAAKAVAYMVGHEYGSYEQ